MKTEIEILTEIQTHKDNIHRKLKQLKEYEQSKKDTAAAWREKIKEVKEEIDDEMDSIEDLEREKLELSATGYIAGMTPPPGNVVATN